MTESVMLVWIGVGALVCWALVMASYWLGEGIARWQRRRQEKKALKAAVDRALARADNWAFPYTSKR